VNSPADVVRSVPIVSLRAKSRRSTTNWYSLSGPPSGTLNLRLADFILGDMERILIKWEAFAATCSPASASMTSSELRDHAKQILEAVAADLRTSQSAEEQTDKSMGLAVAPFGAPETAAQSHALLRAKSGFDINQLVSEYRALRASVLSLWIDSCESAPPFLQDVIRFNEAVDQAVAESVSHYSAWMEQARNLLLGSLSHDMRSPLQTVRMTAILLGQLNAGDEVSAAAGRLIRSGAQLQSLLDDLVDFNRTKLGLGISIVPSQVDLSELCAQELEQLAAAYPNSRVQMSVEGNCHGSLDARRMRQLIGNLVTNAIQYGAPDVPVRVAVVGEETHLRLEVINEGPVIARETLMQLFEPLKRATVNPSHPGLGLGLYIVREIAKGHGGVAEARSDNRETIFSVRLPRRS
jgi:signal transduction histidine kinase